MQIDGNQDQLTENWNRIVLKLRIKARITENITGETDFLSKSETKLNLHQKTASTLT